MKIDTDKVQYMEVSDRREEGSIFSSRLQNVVDRRDFALSAMTSLAGDKKNYRKLAFELKNGFEVKLYYAEGQDSTEVSDNE